MYVAEFLHALKSGPSEVHGEASIKRWPCHPGRDELARLQGRPPLDATPGDRPPDLPVANPPCPAHGLEYLPEMQVLFMQQALQAEIRQVLSCLSQAFPSRISNLESVVSSVALCSHC